MLHTLNGTLEKIREVRTSTYLPNSFLILLLGLVATCGSFFLNQKNVSISQLTNFNGTKDHEYKKKIVLELIWICHFKLNMDNISRK